MIIYVENVGIHLFFISTTTKTLFSWAETLVFSKTSFSEEKLKKFRVHKRLLVLCHMLKTKLCYSITPKPKSFPKNTTFGFSGVFNVRRTPLSNVKHRFSLAPSAWKLLQFFRPSSLLKWIVACFYE
jgi:hypothetical protein